MCRRGHYWDDGKPAHNCEICGASFTQADEATLPEAVCDDGREGRFCPSCRCDLVEDWPSEDCAETELEQVAEWRLKHAAAAA